MKLAIIGGTHGNEPVGIKVIEALQDNNKITYKNEFKTFLGNPKAYEIGKRYVDSDLNRAFGKTGTSKGYETERSAELTKEISGNFNFIFDLHTTTANMGLTVILTHLDDASLKSACYLKKLNPELKIIVSVRAGMECPYTSHMASSGLTIEVGPVANNVVNSELVLATYKMTKEILDFDFEEDFDYSSVECFKTIGLMSYPEKGKWMVHPSVDGHDFRKLDNGEALFINIDGEEKNYEGETIYPLFINEAAYQENNTAMEYAIKTNLGSL